MQDHFRSDFADHVSLQARGTITDTAGCRRAGRLYFALRRRQSEGKPTRSKKGEKGDEQVYRGRGARSDTVATRPRPDDSRLDPGGVAMNRLLIDCWRQWRPDILRWIAAILIFALFAWFIIDYFDYFDSCLNHASCG